MHEDIETAMPSAQEQEVNENAGAKVSEGAAGLWGELWPVLSFLVVYNVMRRFPEGDGWFTPDTALYWATGILMLGMSFEVGKRLLRKEKISPLLLMSTGMVVVFGILGIVFGKGFLLHKPTVINLTFASIIFGGLMTGRNLWRIMFDGYSPYLISHGIGWRPVGGSILLPWRGGTKF